MELATLLLRQLVVFWKSNCNGILDASFDVTFHKDHLDVNWKIKTDEMDGSHGL